MRKLMSEIAWLQCVLLVASTVSVAALFLWSIYDNSSLPIAYYKPDGCAIVVRFEGDRRIGHDCGWEEGRAYRVVYISKNVDLRTLHDGGR